jgi:fructokinase
MILCCGEALIDMIPQADGALMPHPGGAALNTAIALARLDTEVGLLAGLSRDPPGQNLRDALAADGVDFSLAVQSDRPTTLAIVSLPEGQPQYTFLDENSAGRMIAPADLPDIPATVSTLLFGGVSLCHAPAGDSFVLLAESTPDRVIMLDPNIRPALITDEAAYRARLHRMLDLADIIKVSDEDLAWLYPDAPDLAACLAMLAAHDAALVLLTQGCGDVLAIQGARQTRVPVPVVPVRDTVGAGDAFNAGILAHLAKQGLLEKTAIAGGDMAPALRFGVQVAGVSVTRSGANPPTRQELQDRGKRVLVADIGGTNTRIGVALNGVVDETTVQRYPNAGVAAFEVHLARYFQDRPKGFIACCVAVAGPVTGGRAEMTNLDWAIEPARIAAATGAAQVQVINDLAALGYALGGLGDGGVTPVYGVCDHSKGPRLVVGVGTGFNVAVAHGNDVPMVFASESGHMALPVQDAEMLELAQFAAGPDGFCSLEDVLSGRGLETVYRWSLNRAGRP